MAKVKSEFIIRTIQNPHNDTVIYTIPYDCYICGAAESINYDRDNTYHYLYAHMWIVRNGNTVYEITPYNRYYGVREDTFFLEVKAGDQIYCQTAASEVGNLTYAANTLRMSVIRTE